MHLGTNFLQLHAVFGHFSLGYLSHVVVHSALNFSASLNFLDIDMVVN